MVYEPFDEYRKAVDEATSSAALVLRLETWRWCAEDAYLAAAKMNNDKNAEQLWEEFQAGLKKERKGRAAGEAWYEKYMDILLPATMFSVASIAQHYKAPWGLAYNRCVEAGKVIVKDGIARMAAGK